MPSETIHFPSARQLSALYANDERNLDEAELALNVRLTSRDDWITADGDTEAIEATKTLFKLLEAARAQGLRIRSSDFHYTLRCVSEGKADELRENYRNPLVIKLKRQSVVPKTLNQKRYLQTIVAHPITFGIGPAGTGKTYLAMAMALKELLEGKVERTA